ncbi:MAG: ABC transporter permease [Betaproteobacteria bacterium]|nr:ABC transporter permease [Betaproteobacteria bacterium]
MGAAATRHAAVLQGAGFIVSLLLLWELASALGWLRPHSFPPPSRIAQGAWELAVRGFPEGVRVWTHTLVTLRRIFSGFALAMIAAIPLGLLIGRSPTLDALTNPVITFARSVATLSLLPLVIVWFGTGEISKTLLIAYGCFWVMLSNVIAGVRHVDPVLVRAARTMDTPGREIFTHIVLPAALPRIFAGARTALGVGFMVIVGAEMIGTIEGLGALIMEARTFYRTDVTIVGMMLLGVMGVLFALGMEALERRLLPWHRGLSEVRR